MMQIILTIVKIRLQQARIADSEARLHE